MPPNTRWLCLLLLASLLAPAALARAGDWPQILGPQRNGQARGERLAPRWPADGPPLLWDHPVGQGFAGAAIADGKVVLFHRLDEQERVEAWDLQQGRPLWQTDFPASYRGGINPDRGPRCVPLIHGDAVIVFGAAGDAHCLDLQSGATRWSRALYRDYLGQEGYFGAGSTPLVVQDKVLFNVGGRDQAGLVAVNLKDGHTAWQSTRDGASYSSPVLIDRPDQPPRAFVVTRLHALLVDPANGLVLDRVPFGQRGPTVNAATPILFKDHVFLTASYGIGAKLLRIDGDRLASVWSGDDTLSSQYNTPVYHQDHLFGIHGREDLGTAELRCIEARTGQVRWRQTDFGVAHLMLVDSKLLLLTTDGQLVLAAADPRQYTELARSRVSETTVRALPALSDGLLIIRDNQDQKGRVRCFDLRQQ